MPNIGPFENDNLTKALERAPRIHVPADFSARVMANLPKRQATTVVRLRTHWGRDTGLFCLILAMAALGWMARSGRSAEVMLLEDLVAAQLCIAGLWFSFRRFRFRSPGSR